MRTATPDSARPRARAVASAPPQPGSQSRFWQRASGIGAVWIVATVAVLVVAADTSFGPTVLTLSHRHGVHVGDVIALVVSYVVATVLTRLILLRGNER
jgi:hypothetical protein